MKDKSNDPSIIGRKWPLGKARGKQNYSPSVIESKWQKLWEEKKIFSPDLDRASKPYYNLMMFPYPSAEGLHVGNMYAFTGSDIFGRFKRMRGHDVFEPIGLDGFGIHSENYAIKIGRHPKEQAKISEKNFYRQLRATGNAYDWTRTLETYDPDYYKWTQWIFVQLFKKGLAYRKKSPVNFCPSCKTVLADEQVIGGLCERCSSVVEKRELEQWFFKITAYADRLLSGLNKIDWTKKVKIAQRNWIGRKDGITIKYKVVGSKYYVDCWTSRPDTNFGATFIVLAPEHPLALKLTTKENKQTVEDYIKLSQRKSNEERIVEGREKSGVFTGSYAANDLTGERMPIWVSDFVLMEFGTGAVVGVPGHDKRDFEFAKKFGFPIKRVVVGKDGDTSTITKIEQVQEEEGTIINSDFLNGLDIHEATRKITDYIEEKDWGKRKTTYHLRDWLISRQRYWGPPIPMINCQKCGWQSVPEDQLPVLLPDVKDWRPKGTGKSPLASISSFVTTKCPNCGGKARRETDVSDTFLDSSWYFFRYPSVEFRDSPFDSKRIKKWLPVDMYIGGAEHSVLHLLYARFITMVLKDFGLIEFEEPFKKFYAHGLLISEGAKMSKSRGNIVTPDQYIQKYGVDTLRTCLMFLGPFDQGGDFRDTGIAGTSRFLRKVWDLSAKHGNLVLTDQNDNKEILTIQNKTVKKVTEDLENLKFNTAIAALMEYVNALKEKVSRGKLKTGTWKLRPETRIWDEAIRVLLLLLAPFAPHMAEELYQRFKMYDLGFKNSDQKIRKSYPVNRKSFTSIHTEPWPTYNPKLIQVEEVVIPVQVDGKLRDIIKVQSAKLKVKSYVEQLAKKSIKASRYIAENKVKRVVFVPGKLINFVTK